MILADGARADCMEQLLAQGALPNIARHIVQPGAYRRGVTVFPSTTGPAYMPFLTGCLPGTCNVPGIRWMDKSKYRDDWRGVLGVNPFLGRPGLRSYVGLETFRINPDMRADIATLFALLPQSYNIFNAVCRGVTRAHNVTAWMRIWYWYYAHLTDRWDFVDVAATEKLRTVVRGDFEFAFVVFPGIDEYGHLDDPLGAKTLSAYQSVDRAVGLVAADLAAKGQLDDTLWWIVSDHGLTATREHFCVNTFLEARGLRTLYYPRVYRRNCEVANLMSGNGMTHLYFRHRDGWAGTVDYEYLAEHHGSVLTDLAAEPAVDLLAARARSGTVRVWNREGAAEISLTDNTVTYRALTGDPLQLLDAAHPTERCFTREDCLQQTIDSRYPDGPFLLAHLFTSSRTGDVVVSAAPGHDLRLAHEHPEHRGSHGSLHRDHMHVPIVCSAPLTAGPLRTIDVFPTTLQLLGREIPKGIDGVIRI